MIPAFADLRLFGVGSWLNIVLCYNPVGLFPEILGINVSSRVRGAGVPKPLLSRFNVAGFAVDHFGNEPA
jgi:hypothetical protein